MFSSLTVLDSSISRLELKLILEINLQLSFNSLLPHILWKSFFPMLNRDSLSKYQSPSDLFPKITLVSLGRKFCWKALLFSFFLFWRIFLTCSYSGMKVVVMCMFFYVQLHDCSTEKRNDGCRKKDGIGCVWFTRGGDRYPRHSWRFMWMVLLCNGRHYHTRRLIAVIRSLAI